MSGHPQQQHPQGGYPPQQQYQQGAPPQGGGGYPPQQQQPYYPPQQGGPPPQGYAPQQGGPPPQGYAPQQGGPPPQGYAPQQGGYAPQQGGYAPQQGGYAPQQGGYAPQQGGYAPQGGYPPQQGGYAPQQGAYPPQGYAPQHGHRAAPPGGFGGAPMCSFKVRVISGRNLIAADLNGKSDPYVKLHFEGTPKPYAGKAHKDKKKKAKGHKKPKTNVFQTAVLKKTLKPQWDQTFQFNVPPPVKGEHLVSMIMYDWDARGEHDFMGSAHVHLENLQQGVERVTWHKLHGVKKGEIQVGITALNFSSGPADANVKNQHVNLASQNAKKKASAKKTKAAKKTASKIGKGLVKGLGF